MGVRPFATGRTPRAGMQAVGLSAELPRSSAVFEMTGQPPLPGPHLVFPAIHIYAAGALIGEDSEQELPHCNTPYGCVCLPPRVQSRDSPPVLSATPL